VEFFFRKIHKTFLSRQGISEPEKSQKTKNDGQMAGEKSISGSAATR
jgi:hypothetical protein